MIERYCDKCGKKIGTFSGYVQYDTPFSLEIRILCRRCAKKVDEILDSYLAEEAKKTTISPGILPEELKKSINIKVSEQINADARNTDDRERFLERLRTGKEEL